MRQLAADCSGGTASAATASTPPKALEKHWSRRLLGRIIAPTTTGTRAHRLRTGILRSGRHTMVTVGLFVRMEAKPGKEAEVESFLRGGLPFVEAEPATTTWFAIRLAPATFGI